MPQEELKKAQDLFQEGDYQASYRIYESLVQQYPDNQDIKYKHMQCKKLLGFDMYVKQADQLFNEEHDYEAALAKYDMALRINDDFIVQARRDLCAKKVSGGGGGSFLDSFREQFAEDDDLEDAGGSSFSFGDDSSSGSYSPEPVSAPCSKSRLCCKQQRKRRLYEYPRCNKYSNRRICNFRKSGSI